MKQPIWIDSDCGFDDMAAIAMVCSDYNWHVLGLGLTAGNATLDIVAAQACRMKAFFGWQMPLHAGAAKPLIGPVVTAEYVHGPTGMRSTGRTLPATDLALDSDDAVGAMTAALSSSREPVTVLALGPLSTVAIALLARPGLKANIARIVWMGGAAAGGNHTATTEFNAAADPDALAVVLESGIPLRMIGLDCCRQVTINATDSMKIRALQTERASILADLMDGYVRIASADGSRPMPLYDPVAAAAVLDDRAVAFLPVHLSVERSGALTRGTTICEFRQSRAAPNAEVARSALATRVLDRLLSDFTKAAVNPPAGQSEPAAAAS